ncbi:MAG TPA: GNAT family N-acetyltransferase [Segetibacter sp.]|jgi:GNAT superfamily N-acetyltransferase
MPQSISKVIIEKWLKAWSFSRELPSPTKFKSGFKVDVGYEKQKARYVFPNFNDDFINLAKSIVEPWVFLKVCAAPGELKYVLPQRWEIQPQGYMMTCFHRMADKPVRLDAAYRLKFEVYNSTYLVQIINTHGEVAASGRVVLVDDLAIYDRISTEINHRRKGLATLLMNELEKIALSKGVYRNILVATEEGKSLYQSLGWELYSLYTSFVIPD